MRLAIVSCLLPLGGCYYMQAVQGQFEVLASREPLTEVIEDPDTPPELSARLALLRDARGFASEALRLPDNDSYRSYADLGRDYVIWSVIAAPEFSLEPKTWCYLVVGCMAYRGYFSADAAQRKGAALRKAGFDVLVGGVTAYSTLGRFDDPILNTMMRSDDLELVSLLFHELAHQRLYVKGDTEFNESFATAVAETGVQRWLRTRDDPAALERWRERRARRDALATLVADAVRDLERLYAEDLPASALRQRKRQRFEQLSAELNDRTGGDGGSTEGLNNAWLVQFSLYRGSVPAFLELLGTCGGELPCFYAEAERLAALPADERHAALRELGRQRGATRATAGIAVTFGMSADRRRVSPARRQ